MRISYLADRPELAAQLIPGLLEHWSYVFPDQTAAERAAKFNAHLNRDKLPIAWVAHDGDLALGTATLPRPFHTPNPHHTHTNRHPTPQSLHPHTHPTPHRSPTTPPTTPPPPT